MDKKKAIQALEIQARNSLALFSILTDPRYTVNWHHQAIMDKLEAVERGEIKRLILMMPPRHGKQVAHNTLVPTPDGFKKHGDLKPGDYVYNISGKPIKVVAESEEAEQNMRVWFSGNIYVDCHENHEWFVVDRSHNKRIVIETKEIFKQKYYSGGRSRFQINYCKPIWGKNDFELHPYVLGVWLGDGKSSGGGICFDTNDREHIERIKDLGYKIGNEWGDKLKNITVLGIRKELKKLNLINNKHIPQEYLLADEENRRELLRGLIDTDGSVGKDNRVRFININKQLIDDVIILIESLGYRTCLTMQKACTSTSGVNGKSDCYTVSFSPHDNNFFGYLPRKRKKLKAKRRLRGIINIERIEPVKGKCIQVDSPDGLYLITEHFIPTHNSQLASINFPAWYLGRNPNKEIITASYNSDLAQDFGRKTRELVGDSAYRNIFNITLKSDEKSVSKWRTSSGGTYTSVGVGGAITGRGADIFIIDDPLKNREEADSLLIRDKQWQWYTSTAYTRLEKGAAIILILTRWSYDDLAGRLIQAMEDGDGEKWEIVKFPAVALEEEKHRKVGEPLWKDKYNIEALDNIKKTVGLMDWSSLYQQEPLISEIQEFKEEYFRYFEENEIKDDKLNINILVDPAISKKDEACNTGVIDVAKKPDKPFWYVMDDCSGKLDPYQLIRLLFVKVQYYEKTYPQSNVKVWVETNAYQEALMYFFKEEMRRQEIYFHVNELKSRQDKNGRIRGLVPLYKSGVVFHRPSMKKGNMEMELLQFPYGRFVDRIDALAFNLAAVPQTRTKKQKKYAPINPSSLTGW